MAALEDKDGLEEDIQAQLWCLCAQNSVDKELRHIAIIRHEPSGVCIATGFCCARFMVGLRLDEDTCSRTSVAAGPTPTSSARTWDSRAGSQHHRQRGGGLSTHTPASHGTLALALECRGVSGELAAARRGGTLAARLSADTPIEPCVLDGK